MPEERCADCISFWKPAGTPVGTCRGEMPKVFLVSVTNPLIPGVSTPSTFGVWPPVADNEWCRQFRRASFTVNGKPLQ